MANGVPFRDAREPNRARCSAAALIAGKIAKTWPTCAWFTATGARDGVARG